MPLNRAKIRDIREERGLSREDAAQKADISASLWAKIELDQRGPSLETLESMAKALSCHPGDFFFDDDYTERKNSA